jgi:hypothetical protein
MQAYRASTGSDAEEKQAAPEKSAASAAMRTIMFSPDLFWVS